ncbi:hypothetical protein PspLS_05213 [Pyricularia sp. CBS 133598]|nr:hypothetical protein PspLS_05213 [Pyricularia sp. CBS 133598]
MGSKKRKAKDMQDTTVHFDDKGDLRLQVGTEEKIFVVCSRAVSRASNAFERMLNGPFAESKPVDPNIDWVVKLPEDSARGLELLLNVIHARFKLIPGRLDLGHLFDVAVVADKYDMIGALKPWCKQWLEDLQQPGRPFFPRFSKDPKPADARLSRPLAPALFSISQAFQLLWTAWTLGSRYLYNSVAGDLVLRIRSKRSILTAAEIGDYYFDDSQFSEMRGFKLANSASIIDPIIQARLDILDEMIDGVRKLEARLKDPQHSTCKSTKTKALINSITCKTMLMGCVYMHESVWSSFPKSGKHVNETIEEFEETTSELNNTFKVLPGHKPCSPANEVAEIISQSKSRRVANPFILIKRDMEEHLRFQVLRLRL